MKNQILISLSAVLFTGITLFPLLGYSIPSAGNESLYEEAKRVCSGAHYSSPRKCIRAQYKNFSDASKKKISELRPHWKERVRACKGDAERLCGNVPRGRGRRFECLADKLEHAEALSAACATTIQLATSRK